MIDFTKLTDEKLVKRARNLSCTHSTEELISRHKMLYFSTCHKYHKKHPTTNLQDLLDDIYIVFNNSIQKYNNKKKAKFSTFLSYMSYWHALNSNKTHGKSINFENSDIDRINESNNKYHNFSCDKKDLNDYALSILNQLSDKRASIVFYERFIVGGKGSRVQSWNTIAKKLNLSVSGVINIYTSALKILKSKIKSNNLFDNV